MDLLKRTVVHDDMIQYYFFLVEPNVSDPLANEQCLQRLVEEILAKVTPLLVQYIWHQQPFNLKYYPEKGGLPAHIGGSTQFGDNVEDEWFIVYLLLQITASIPELAVRLEDNDGEFVLIEVADYLPKWLNPESSQNRVFLHKGELHILPCPSRSSEVGLPRDVVPSVAQALALLSSHTQACLASPNIRKALAKRLDGYPEKIQTHFHLAHCFLPAGIVTVLAQRPDLVAPAVSAFYLRDPVDLQACRTFRTFPPDTRVLTSVKFTRCLYAQLQQQHFIPDRRSGFTLPARSHPLYQAHELGMKLAHGFEILCSKATPLSSEPDVPISCNPLWRGFVDSLKKNDYFKGELEGSAHYRELMTSAQNFFKQSVNQGQSSSSRAPGEEVLQLLQSSPPPDLEDLRRQESLLPPETSDSWLDISAQDLEHLLEERGGRGLGGSGVGPSSRPTTEVRSEEVQEGGEASYSLVAVTQGMKNFINTMSSHEGAELPWSLSNEPFQFDPDSMASALDKLMGVKEEMLDSDDLDDDDDDDDDEEEEEEEEAGLGGSSQPVGPEALNSLRRYMDEMDQELQGTSVGQSFTQKDGGKPDLGSDSPRPPGGKDIQGEEEVEIQPLDVDLNLVTNLLQSLSSQAGLAGPASNLLQSMGLHLPPNTDRS